MSNAYGQDAKIPPVFTKNLLLKPVGDRDEVTPPTSENRVLSGKLEGMPNRRETKTNFSGV